MDQIILEPDSRTSRCWNRGRSWIQKDLDVWSWGQCLKFEFQFHNPAGFIACVWTKRHSTRKERAHFNNSGVARTTVSREDAYLPQNLTKYNKQNQNRFENCDIWNNIQAQSKSSPKILSPCAGCPLLGYELYNNNFNMLLPCLHEATYQNLTSSRSGLSVAYYVCISLWSRILNFVKTFSWFD